MEEACGSRYGSPTDAPGTEHIYPKLEISNLPRNLQMAAEYATRHAGSTLPHTELNLLILGDVLKNY